MSKLLNFLGLKWVKIALVGGISFGILYLLFWGFKLKIIEPAVQKRLNPLQQALESVRADSTRISKNDSLKLVQIHQLQSTIRDVRIKAKSDSTEHAEMYLQNVTRLQLNIRTLVGIQKEVTDSLRKAESGLRIDLVTLKYGWLGKLKDSTYVQGYRWPLIEDPIEDMPDNRN